jgi:DNA-binding FadR family transcriptional regulator
MIDPRFAQLLSLARNGDECAISDLWNEFDFDFHSEIAPSCQASEGGASC